MVAELRYADGLSKYAITKALFPDDSLTHRMKRMQRAARLGLWTHYFNLHTVTKNHAVGTYEVSYLQFKDRAVVSDLVMASELEFMRPVLEFPDERPRPAVATEDLHSWRRVWKYFVDYVLMVARL
jgi:hypothetical protein